MGLEIGRVQGVLVPLESMLLKVAILQSRPASSTGTTASSLSLALFVDVPDSPRSMATICASGYVSETRR